MTPITIFHESTFNMHKNFCILIWANNLYIHMDLITLYHKTTNYLYIIYNIYFLNLTTISAFEEIKYKTMCIRYYIHCDCELCGFV